MNNRMLAWLLFLAALFAVLWWEEQNSCSDGKCQPPAPITPPDGGRPQPPRPSPGPWGPRAPAGLRDGPVLRKAWVGGEMHPDGTEIACPLPGQLHLRNVGGRDGAGLCVFTSIAHSARWQNVPLLENFRDWMRSYPGGGYPSKVDRMIDRLTQQKGSRKPEYIQIEGDDLALLEFACRNDLMPSVTYWFSPSGRYGGRGIAHMVNLVHADDRHFVILDNNYPGDTRYEWMTREAFRKVYTGGRNGWAVILLSPGPPMPPRNHPQEQE